MPAPGWRAGEGLATCQREARRATVRFDCLTLMAPRSAAGQPAMLAYHFISLSLNAADERPSRQR